MTVSELQSSDTSTAMNTNSSKPMTVSELQSKAMNMNSSQPVTVSELQSKAMNMNTDFPLYHIL